MGWVVKTTTPSLYLQERDPVPIVYENGWTSGPAWTSAEKNCPYPPAFDPRTVQSVESSYIKTSIVYFYALKSVSRYCYLDIFLNFLWTLQTNVLIVLRTGQDISSQIPVKLFFTVYLTINIIENEVLTALENMQQKYTNT